jgi:mitochondrial fission protein ELM1
MKILLLNDGIKGNLHQSLAIARLLSDTVEIVTIRIKGPSYRLPMRKGRYPIISKLVGFLLRLGLKKTAHRLLQWTLIDGEKIFSLPYDTIISTGSSLAPINAILKKEHSFSICILTPEGIPLSLFDALVVPKHDLLRHPSLKKHPFVIATLGAPTPVTRELLEDEARHLSSLLPQSPPSPKIALLIGGDDQTYHINPQWLETLIHPLSLFLKKEGAQSLVTTSRRTSHKSRDKIRLLTEEKEEFPYREFPEETKKSHYFGILGISDMILVTEDSINMISEACSTGKPVIVLEVCRKKDTTIFESTIAQLERGGHCVRIAIDQLPTLPAILQECKSKHFTALNEAQRCSALLRTEISRKKSSL